MRVLRPVIEIPMLAMFHAREDFALGGAIALEFIRDDDPRSVLTAFEELAEKLLGGPFVPPPLHQDIEWHCQLNEKITNILVKYLTLALLNH
jgi:hypothetical protein